MASASWVLDTLGTGCSVGAGLALRESLRRRPDGREPPGTSLDAENSQGYFQASVASGQRLAQNQVSSSTKKELHTFPQSVISELRADCFLWILSVF